MRGRVVPASLGEAGRRAEAAGQHSGAGEEQRRVTVDGGEGSRAGAAGRPTEHEQAGLPSTCGVEQSRSLVSFFFPHPTGATEEMDADIP
jgi:hypothetical protein